MESYEIAIIGSGPAGYVGAVAAARSGVDTCVIEKDDFGGVCLNTGCIPTKAVISSAKLLRSIRKAGEHGIEIQSPLAATLGKMYERKNRVVDIEKKGLIKLVEKVGAAIIKGSASFIDKNTLKIAGPDGDRVIYANNIIIATGSKAAELPFLPFDGEKVLSSRDILALEEKPESLLIVGGGYIGCEFASLFSALGTKVTIVEALPRLLPEVDEDIAGILTTEFKKEKIDIKTNSRIVDARVEDRVSVTLEDGSVVYGDVALIAVGRRPYTDGLGMETVGVQTLSKGEIKVNNQMMTNVPGIFAVGDVVGNPMLAHVASAECKIAVGNALGNRYIMDYTVIPASIYTYPEIGSVGITEAQAKRMGMDIRIGSVQLRSLGISHAAGEIAGIAKIITDAISDTIIGIHMIGDRSADIIHEVAVAMFHGMTSSMLSQVIHAHPTFSESIAEAAQDVHGEAIHIVRKAA